MDDNDNIDLNDAGLGVLAFNETLDQITKYFNISISNLTNQSVETQVKLFDLYEMYKTKEKEQLMVYKFVAYIVGTLIILSNLTVVISSGLILKKGQQPKSTYLLLGNVSLADTIVGISIIFGTIVDNNMSSNPLCIFQIGMLVCPAMVSIFSVGLIAVDRYIYILHGLYYQRWFTTTKVRIGIVCIWMIGLTLGFLPATGLVNRELNNSYCNYVGLFPGSLILLNSLLSIVPIIAVGVLYSIILVKALANVKKINTSNKSLKSETENPKLRFYRGNGYANKSESSFSVKYLAKVKTQIQRSASFTNNYDNKPVKSSRSMKSKSINDLIIEDVSEKMENVNSNSEFSIYTIESGSDPNVSTYNSEISVKPNVNSGKKNNKTQRPKEPNKWRAITVVMLTSAIFISSLPAMGWTGKTFRDYRCWYIALFPASLLILVSVLVLSVIVMVVVLYILILHSAVKTVDKIREYRETNSIAYVNKVFQEECTPTNVSTTKITITISKDTTTEEAGSSIEMHELRTTDIEEQRYGSQRKRKVSKISTYYGQAKALNSNPSKLKAVKTVLIVILCFVGTWAPYYVTVIVYVRCDILVHGYDCLPLEVLTLGPLFMLGVCNSLCDPLIYAWRHSGFKKTIRKLTWRYIWKMKMQNLN